LDQRTKEASMTMLWQSAGLEVLGEAEAWSLLASQPVGRLAVAIRNHPDIFPVNYLVDDHTIVFRTDPGVKLAAATAGSSVAFEADHYEPSTGAGWSVVVTGEAREVKKLDDQVRIEKLPLVPAAAGRKNRWVRIHPLSISGRRIPTPT
jgi:nitroimidazol reductase NimA-like FMN-containing flavoprotein (pyridoxamine 5'-phosphate oxidase superfamily)